MNKSKVIVTQYGLVHYLAQCTQCDFDCAIGKTLSRQDVRNAVYQHVLKTGHTVRIEGGNATKYEKRDVT